MVLDPEGERRARQQTRHQATHCASCESCWPVFLLLHRFSSHTPFLFIYLPSPHLYLLKVLPFERAKWMFFGGVVIGNNLQHPAPRFEFGSPFHFKHKAPTHTSISRGSSHTTYITSSSQNPIFTLLRRSCNSNLHIVSLLHEYASRHDISSYWAQRQISGVLEID